MSPRRAAHSESLDGQDYSQRQSEAVFNVQAVFVYRYLPPFGTIQVAYQRGTAAFGQRSTQGDTLFLKATTVF